MLAMTQKITGYGLREALRSWERRRDVAASSFSDSLRAFPDDKKELPKAIFDEFTRAEHAIAALQEAQAGYNLLLTVPYRDGGITLCRAVKLLGGAGRGSRMWRDATGGGKRDPYYRAEETRQKDTTYQRRTISQADCLKEAAAADKAAGQLREGIARANGVEVSIDDIGLDAALLV